MSESLKQLADSLNIATAQLSGDPRRLQLALGQVEERKRREEEEARQAAILKAASTNPELAQFLNLLGPQEGAKVYAQTLLTKKPSATANPLRTITRGGKVIDNIRDQDLTDAKIDEIIQSGAVIQPLGFTEKFESTKDVDFDPIKKKYLATESIITGTSKLAQQFASQPESALAISGTAQFVDSVIKNIDSGLNILAGAKDNKVYELVQSESKSLEGTDFTDRIEEVSAASGVADSQIKDLAYLFAAARGQEGRGLSDKDYENALRIVSGGVGAEGRAKVLGDVSNRLRDEFYRAIEFDIATSTNQTYVNRLKDLPVLPQFVDPFAQSTTSTPTNIDELVKKYNQP
tara:strand:+ start:627 stop:1667 length:1041 start_codon:yes stop_codon:yes gene_type:complete